MEDSPQIPIAAQKKTTTSAILDGYPVTLLHIPILGVQFLQGRGPQVKCLLV